MNKLQKLYKPLYFSGHFMRKSIGKSLYFAKMVGITIFSFIFGSFISAFLLVTELFNRRL